MGHLDLLKISLSVLGDSSSSVGVVLEDSDLLEGLADVPLDRGRGVGVVGGSDSSSVLASVELGERSDTNVLSEVDVSSDGG